MPIYPLYAFLITRNRVSPGLEPELELVEGAERSVDILFCDNVNSFWPVG